MLPRSKMLPVFFFCFGSFYMFVFKCFFAIKIFILYHNIIFVFIKMMFFFHLRFGVFFIATGINLFDKCFNKLEVSFLKYS